MFALPVALCQKLPINKTNCRMYKTPTFTGRKVVKRDFSSMATSIVVTRDRLNIDDVMDVMNGKIMALRIPNFCGEEVVDHALSGLKKYAIKDYDNAEGVGKIADIGMAYFEVVDEQTSKKYYAQRLNSLAALRDVFSPYQSPLDKIRVVLGDQWPHQATLLDLGKGPMFVGLTRAIKGEIIPHEDKLERDDPTALEKINYVGQMAFNCYLQVPQEGGELELWNESLSTEVYDQLRGDSYGIDRSKIPLPVLKLKPKKGEFIAFNGRKLHAVTKGSEGEVRIANSGFMLYQGPEKPLAFWS